MNNQNSKHSIIISAILAAVGYGGWAVYINFEHGQQACITAGLVQGTYAFASTLFITKVAHFVYQKCGYGKRGIIFGFFTSFLAMLIFPLTLHTLAATPNIIETILPGLIWGSIYLMGVLISLEATRRAK